MGIQRFFYAFGSEEPPRCRLEQLWISVSGYPVSVLDKAHDKLVDRISHHLAAQPVPVDFRSEDAPLELGDAGWRNWIQIRNDTVSVYVYLTSSAEGVGTLWLLARDMALVKEKEETEHLNDQQSGIASVISTELEASLRTTDSAAARFLGVEEVYDSVSLEELYTSIVRLLTPGSDGAQGEPEKWLAADYLAMKFTAEGNRWDRRRQSLRSFGLSYKLLDGWYYQHNLLARCWMMHPDDRWGQAALTVLLDMGFDTAGGCGAGADEFSNVIATGEQLLRQYPSSPWEKQVMYMMGEAYETWWSIAQAREDEYVGDEAGKDRPGAEQARLKAIDYYEKVDASELTPTMQLQIRHRLPRLKLGIDTNQRKFWCIYD